MQKIVLFVTTEDRQKTKTETDLEHLNTALRDAVAAGAEEITVSLTSGQYFLETPLVLSPETVGRGCPIRFVCPDSKPAAFCGWLPVTGFTETEVNGVRAWAAPIPKEDGKPRNCHSFFDKNGARLERPRFPETGFLRPVGIPGYEDDPNPFKTCTIWGVDITKNRNYDFYFAPGELPPMTRLSDVQVNMLHFWVGEKMSVRDIDREKNIVSMVSAPVYRLLDESNDKNGKQKGARYFLDNVFEMLRKPGQVYEDRGTGTLYYIPRDGESPENCVVYAADTQQLLIINGTERISFDNVAFVGTDWKRTDRHVTVGAQQAAADVTDPAVTVNDASDLRFSGCAFEHIGNYAVQLQENVHGVTFEGCSFRDLGAGGIWCAGSRAGNYEDGPAPEVSNDITIQNCVVSDYGIIFPDAVGIFFQYAYDVRIAHNEISHGRYSGISMGWSWSNKYAFQPAGYRVEKNHVYDIGMGLTSDIGAIYTNGKLINTTISGNVIHDVKMVPGGYGGWGIYTDAFSAGITIENNLVFDCSAEAFNSSQSNDNLVRNNIFAFGHDSAISSVSSDGHNAFLLKHNVLVTNYAPVYRFHPEDKNCTIFTDDGNLLWDYALGTAYSCGDPFPAEKTDELRAKAAENRKTIESYGYYKNAVIADPQFKDPGKRDFTLLPDSPALKIGFVPFATDDVGPQKHPLGEE